MIIKTMAYARAGLLGNPSDGYYGKTVSVIIKNYRANVILYHTPEINIIPNKRDHSRFRSMAELVSDVRLNSYYGGIRLIKASIKVFYEYCTQNNIVLDNRNFTIEYNSNIPRQVGMAGSSAIITAVFRALISFYQVDIPKPILPNLILSVETRELNIGAGLQDRVIQTYEGVVFMDFDKKFFDKNGHGIYEELPADSLPGLYAAYRTDIAEVSGKVHNNIKERFELGDRKIISAMKKFAEIAAQGKSAILEKKYDKVSELINKNFDLRRSLYNIDDKNVQMVETARSCGASAKFSGSGGAVIGICPNEKTYKKLQKKLGEIGIKVFRPKVA
ncbi:MAG: mevalonate kinase [Fibrobacterota bacterium]